VNATTKPVAAPSLAHLPLPLLAIPMGLGGAGLAWRQAGVALGAPGVVGEALLLLTALAWLGLVALHARRVLRHPAAVLAELKHPVRAAFIAAPTIGVMIISAALFPYAPSLAAGLWCVAVTLHLLVAMLLLRRILGGGGDVAMLAPPLLIPFVGNILAPVFGVRMGFADMSWMMFGVGFFLWLVVTPLLLHRLIAGPALPPPLRPTLAILLAPPAVGALALSQLLGTTGGPVLALVGLAVLVACVLLSLAFDFAKTPFSLAWWSFTFPSAAFAVMLMAEGFPAPLCWFALAVATGITGWCAWKTALAARSGALLRPEH
jgi:tellurite resistance protein